MYKKVIECKIQKKMPCTREVVNLNNIKSQSLLHYAMIESCDQRKMKFM